MDGDVLIFAQVMTVIVCSVGALVMIGFGAKMLWHLSSRKKLAPWRVRTRAVWNDSSQPWTRSPSRSSVSRKRSDSRWAALGAPACAAL
jgi:hypothetical protein